LSPLISPAELAASWWEADRDFDDADRLGTGLSLGVPEPEERFLGLPLSAGDCLSDLLLERKFRLSAGMFQGKESSGSEPGQRSSCEKHTLLQVSVMSQLPQ